jgi:hypothetical protein
MTRGTSPPNNESATNLEAAKLKAMGTPKAKSTNSDTNNNNVTI